MVVTFIGYLYEIAGVAILLLPLLFRELSRPRDSIWGGLIVISGLIFILDNDRFFGAPQIAESIGLLVFIRLFIEVSRHRWQLLSQEEKTNLKSIDRFNTSFRQSFVAFTKLGIIFFELIKSFQPKQNHKKWIRIQNASQENSAKEEDFDSQKAVESKGISSPDKISSRNQVNIASEDT